jgi:dTMP kinase
VASGCLIAFEGPEGAGKSTQLRRAADVLAQDGYRVTVTVEPGGTALGQRVRHLLLHDQQSTPTALAELFLILADRAQHVRERIAPAIADGQIVLSDRFSGSTMAYQGYGRGLDLTMVTAADAWARQGIEPRLTVLLDCPADLGLRRARGDDRFHAEDLAFHERVRQGFLTLAAANPVRWHVIDTTQPVTTVAATITEILRRHVASARA